MSKSYSDRVVRFRRSVYRHPTIPSGCKVLLLYMSDRVNANGTVSVPRSELANALAVAPARITEWVTAAKKAGFLDTVRRGQPGVTAVYHLLIVGTESVPLLVRKTFPSQGYGNRTSKTDSLVRKTGSQVVQRAVSDQEAGDSACDEASTRGRPVG